MKLILASGSPRRKELLKEAGYEYEIILADVDEKDKELSHLGAEPELGTGTPISRALCLAVCLTRRQTGLTVSPTIC